MSDSCWQSQSLSYTIAAVRLSSNPSYTRYAGMGAMRRRSACPLTTLAGITASSCTRLSPLECCYDLIAVQRIKEMFSSSFLGEGPFLWGPMVFPPSPARHKMFPCNGEWCPIPADPPPNPYRTRT